MVWVALVPAARLVKTTGYVERAQQTAYVLAFCKHADGCGADDDIPHVT